MTDSQISQQVVVTDIRMPFWSMVTFMVKWSIAAIPAVIMLVAIVMGSMAVVSGLIGSIGQLKPKEERTTFIPQGVTSEYEIQKSKTPAQPGYAADVPDRCKGSVELEKCVESARQLATETEEQKSARRNALEVERRANLEKAAHN